MLDVRRGFGVLLLVVVLNEVAGAAHDDGWGNGHEGEGGEDEEGVGEGGVEGHWCSLLRVRPEGFSGMDKRLSAWA